MNSEPVKICPTCNCEYVVSAEVCADCGGLLKFPEELHAGVEQDTSRESRELDPVMETEAGRLEALRILESSYSAGHPETPAAGEVSIKICPACRTEYQPSAQVCADCGVTLQFLGSMAAMNRIERGTRAPDQGVAGQLPHSPDLICLRIAQLNWIRDLHSRLSREGIPIRLEVEKTDGSHNIHRWFYRLLVRPGDFEAAAAADRAYVREHMSEQAESVPAGADAPGKCPACGADVTPDSSACPDCDLAFPEEESQAEPSA
ncbi:MAG: hypothetical protein O7F16_05500 [Acidobacteria bacterium]|nr:hypothetical protein [Acidobacteriota bacterium]